MKMTTTMTIITTTDEEAKVGLGAVNGVPAGMREPGMRMAGTGLTDMVTRMQMQSDERLLWAQLWVEVCMYVCMYVCMHAIR